MKKEIYNRGKRYESSVDRYWRVYINLLIDFGINHKNIFFYIFHLSVELLFLFLLLLLLLIITHLKRKRVDLN